MISRHTALRKRAELQRHAIVCAQVQWQGRKGGTLQEADHTCVQEGSPSVVDVIEQEAPH